MEIHSSMTLKIAQNSYTIEILLELVSILTSALFQNVLLILKVYTQTNTTVGKVKVEEKRVKYSS